MHHLSQTEYSLRGDRVKTGVPASLLERVPLEYGKQEKTYLFFDNSGKDTKIGGSRLIDERWFVDYEGS